MRHATATLTACVFITQAFLFGCSSEPDPSLVFLDLQGNEVASAELSLPDVLPAIGISFDGNWSLSASTPAFPETATRSGTYTGYVSTSSVSCNLNPNVADNNVVLIGTIVDGVYAGTWVLESDAGPEPMGTFRLSPGR